MPAKEPKSSVRKQVPDSQRARLYKAAARTRVTNGKDILAGVDGRSLWARRFRDLLALHLADMGGEANVSASELAILRRACCQLVELERMECRFALEEHGPDPQALNLHQRISNSLRRNLTTLGLKRRPKDVTPTLSEYIAQRQAHIIDPDYDEEVEH
jgi:hypothetical protein